MAAAHLLGDDGRGYELARRLEACGAWRAWLGDGAHASLAPHLASSSTWDAFLCPSSSSSSSPPRQLLLLQLRVRALLFDKASAALVLRDGASPAGPHSLNASYLQLHGDDIYFSLEDEQEDNTQHQLQSGTAFSPSRENSMLSQRHKRHDELPGTWYKQYAEKFRTLHGKFRPDEKEMPKRTPEGMSDYLKVCSVHKRKRTVFIDNQSPNIMLENGEFSNLTDDPFIPEIQFPADCVPDIAIPRESGISISNKIEVHGVLDNLPAPVSRNTAMLERFGMMPEYYKTGNKYRGKDVSKVEGKSLSQEQALLITRKLVARYLAVAGFESGTAGSVDDFSDIIVKHISKLGRSLKLITDSYRKQFSSIELLKMFLQTVGYSNIGPLMEITKMGSRVASHPVHQDAQVQSQNNLLQAQQLQRQYTPQMTIHNQNLTAQQHQMVQQHQWARRNQMTGPRGALAMSDKAQALVNVKLENTMDSQNDSPYGSLTRQQQQQIQNLRHHQLLQQQQQKQLQQQQLLQLQQHHQQQQQQQQQLQPQQLQQQQQLQPQQQQKLQQHHQQQQQQLQQVHHQQQQHLQQQLGMSVNQSAQGQLGQQQLGMSGNQSSQAQLAQQQQQLGMSGNQSAQAQLAQQQQLGMSGNQSVQAQLTQQQQQQQLGMSGNQSAQAQLAQQFKQAPQSMNSYGMRVPPVKVEAFHELVSGDSSSDTSKLTSPK
ncbi:uncharacterized protein LOC123452794 [Hordeum vulgare subsp. vulgare]|uniref:Predicted protein n=2 Tax=Hordeum vulgare TaxID=4513 RepID=F2D3B1_HORVV|nr:uncharacterized protein LOC123452794 [Hordeum vulgare subsp. vulgare]BAJ89582.1 predicted protein [Hordeum vulgare subsp. vulgare]